MGICCVKGSILYLYHRIFFVSRPLTIALWLVAAFVLGYSIAQVFGAIFQCVPIDSNWNPKVTGHCINLDVFATVLAALNSFTDIVILVLPMPLVWRLKRPAHEKVQIMGMFLLGGLYVILPCSISSNDFLEMGDADLSFFKCLRRQHLPLHLHPRPLSLRPNL